MMDLELVLRILEIGLPGLVFLIAYLAYGVLRREQKKEHADPTMLQYAQRFYHLSIGLVLLVALVSVLQNFVLRTPLEENAEAIVECRSSTEVLGSLATLSNQALADLQSAVSAHVSLCTPLLERLDR